MNRRQESSLLNMIDIKKRSQLKPVFTNGLYKHREQLSIAPSMLTLQYLNEGRPFGVKSAQQVQNHPQIRALSGRTSALQASKPGSLVAVPLAQPLPPPPAPYQPPQQPPPPPPPPAQPSDHNSYYSSSDYQFNSPSNRLSDDTTTTDTDYYSGTSQRRDYIPPNTYNDDDNYESDYVPAGFMDNDFTPHATDENMTVSSEVEQQQEESPRRYQDEPLPPMDDTTLGEDTEIDESARVSDPVQEIALFWNDKSQAVVLDYVVANFKSSEIYQLLLTFVFWVCDPRTSALLDEGIKILAAPPRSIEGRIGDLVIYNQHVGENILEAFASTQREQYKLIPLPSQLCSSSYSSYDAIIHDQIDDATSNKVDEFELTNFPMSKYIFVKFNEYLETGGASGRLYFRHSTEMTKEAISTERASTRPEASLIEIFQIVDEMYEAKHSSVSFQRDSWI